MEHVIQGSEFLGFHGGYTAPHGIEAAAGRGRGRVTLGRDDLRDAVNNLAASENREERARSLLVVIQMTAESIRFNKVLFFILDNYVEGRGAVPDSLLLQLENSWGILSKSLAYDAHHDDVDFFPITHMDGITQRRFITRQQAIGALGMLSSAVKGNIVHTQLSVDLAVRGNQGSGQPLVEVFHLYINKIEHEFWHSTLYGTINVRDGVRHQHLYSRRRTEAHSVVHGLTIFLAAEECISASDYFTIEVSLFDRAYFSTEKSIAKGRFTWESKNSSNKYDNVLSEEFSREISEVTIFYAVFSDAVQALVEVKLINADNEKRPDVIGSFVRCL